MGLMVGLLTIYVFVVIGFIAKRLFYDTLHQQSFVTIYIYFFMPIGAYTYSRGTFSVKESILNVLKLPIIWATGLAFIIQWKGILIANHCTYHHHVI